MSGIPNLPGRPKPSAKPKGAATAVPKPTPAPEPSAPPATRETPAAAPAAPRQTPATRRDGSTPGGPIARARALVRAIPTPVKLLVVCAAPLVSLGVIMMLPTQGVPDVTSTILAEAQAKWKANRPDKYAMVITFDPRTGYSSEAEITVRVEGEEAVSGTKNGRTMDGGERVAWSVDALFEQLDEEVKFRDLAAEQAGSSEPPIFVRAEFDETMGFPRFMEREQRGRPKNYGVSITGFRSLDEN